jgi:CheY-like chemotaxis protein/HD-like signal output (HDOD) protein
MSKPSVLFVDDESHVLDGLRRSLRGKRGAWEMRFAPGGAQALEMLAESPSDVIVSDMRMPGMDGAELLTRVSERHPQIGRVVLSGHIDPEATIRVAVTGHRFLTKPCATEHVAAVVEQMLVRTSHGHDSSARRIAGAVRAIPSLPEHVERIVALLAPGADLSLAARTAMHDIGLAAKLLQLSNSRFFGSRPRNSSIESTVHSMGVPMVQAVAGAGHSLRPTTAWDPTIERHLMATWRHAVSTARLVELVASPANRPHAQAAALLQDVGSLICLAAVADARGAGVDLAAQTRDGVPFRDVAVELLHLWGVHPPIVAAVAQRDTPQSPDVSGLGVAASVRTAHLLIQQSAEPGSGAGDEELARLLSHPQLAPRAIDWGRAADEASHRADEWAAS